MEQKPTIGTRQLEDLGDYKFGIIDPRPTPEARATNDKLFENPKGVLGIELTIPEYATRCTLGNIDPQHTDGNAELAAIEVAKTYEVPPNGATMITVRADLDALGSMALLKYRASGGEITPEMLARVEAIAFSDKSSRGGWPGKKDLPSRDKPLPKSESMLAGISARVSDYKVPFNDRIQSMEDFLTQGKEPVGYREKVDAERVAIVEAIEKGEIQIEILEDGNISYVKSLHRAGTSLGYSQAPVVVVFNPKFKAGPGEPYEKYTICQYDDSWIDLVAVKNELSKLEEGWGGTPTIIGSPQGKTSELSKDIILKIVAKHIKKKV